MLKRIVGVVVLLIFALVVYVGASPSHYEISREVIINATPGTIFPYLNNSEKMQSWMPWKEQDPGVQMVFSGPAEGAGAKTSWDSKGQLGKADATIIESTPNSTVKTQITYYSPMQMSQISEMEITGEGEASKVRWTVTGENGFISRFFCLFFSMDDMVGKEFTKGLNNLKNLTETK